MRNESKEKAIAWIKDEIRSLELAPKLNGCPMTQEWAEQLEIMGTCLEAVQDHFPDSTKMMPLSLEQLREMGGKPVYIISKRFGISEWNVISGKVWVTTAYDVPSKGLKSAEEGIKFINGRTLRIASYGTDWLSYAYPPAHIDREAWGPCDQCKSCESCYKLHSFHCYDCKEMSEFVPDSSFCGKCGRPRTFEAWKQMEKRLRG